MTWTVPVVRLRGSGRPLGVTTTSPKSIADAGEKNAVVETSAMPIPTERKDNRRIDAPFSYVPRQELQIFLELRAGPRRGFASPARKDARLFPVDGSPATPAGQQDSLRALR